MDKECIIKNIVGDVLMPEGFSYIGKQDNGGGFIRKIENSKHERIRQIISFHEDMNMVYMEVWTSAAGHMSYRMKNFVPGCTDYALRYSNDEEFVQVIKDYADVLQKYGIAYLKRIAEPVISDYFTDEDQERLYKDYELLANKFIKRENLDLEQFDVEQAVTLIEQRMLEIIKTPFVKAHALILELCAFFGAVAMQYHFWRWELKDITLRKISVLKFPNAKLYSGEIAVLTILEIGWRTKKGVKDNLLKKYKQALFPFTYEELGQFGKGERD